MICSLNFGKTSISTQLQTVNKIYGLSGGEKKKRSIYVTFCIKVKNKRKNIIRRQQEFLSVRENVAGGILPRPSPELTINSRVLGIKVD